MKRVFVLLVILILPVMLFATGNQQQGKEENYLRFAWWGNPTRDERTEGVIRLFEQKNPGVTIEAEPTGWAGYWDRMNTLAAAGNLPDVMQQDVSYIKQYTDRNQLQDLTSYSARGGAIDLSQWSEGGLAPGKLNGRLVGLLLGTNAWGILVDPAVLQRAGVTIDDKTWTWEDYEKIAMQIYQRTGVQTNPSYNTRQAMEHITRQFGIPCFAANERSLGMTGNQSAINAARELIEIELRLATAGALFNPEEAFIQGLAMPEEPLPKGKTWNQTNWSNQFVGLQNAAGRPLQYLMFPTVAGNKAPYGTYLRPSMYISMLASSENKNLAAKFINFFINDLEANRILMGERGVPIPTNVRSDLYPRVSEGDKHIFDYITKITPLSSPADPPYPAAAGEVETLLRNIMLEALTKRIPNAETAIQRMIQQSNAVLTR